MVDVLNKMTREGYTESFMVVRGKLSTASRDQTFTPEEVQIVNFYRFEGTSNPDDSSIVYVIEAGGLKGTLVDAYGTYADAGINDFIKAVPDIQKLEKK